MTDTNQLLRDYAERGSEGAFRELVGRYLNFVYSVALRRVDGDSHVAEDIVQTVFSDLAREARSPKTPLLRGPCALGGWLHQHTCFVASTFRRTEQRRQNRERIAAEMNSLENTGEQVWQQLAPMLDEAIQELSPEDRNAILLRFYEQRDLRSVGLALGVSEDAAQKRLSRGVEKLRILLEERGITLSAGILAAFLAEQVVAAAPANLEQIVSNAALAGATKTTGAMTWLLKRKVNLLAGAVVIGLMVAFAPFLRYESHHLSPAVSIAAAGTVQGQPPTGILDTSGNARGNGNEAKSTQPATFEGLRLKLLAADSSKPVPSITIDYWCWDGTQVIRKKLQGTRLGTCEVPFSRATTTQLKLTTQMDGFADTCLHWRPDRGEQIPTEYTLRLGRAVPIGGRVVDEEGLPVAYAKVGWNHEQDPVTESRPENHWFGWIEVETDAEGKWGINRIAEDMVPRIYGSARHPEKAGSEFVFVSRKPEVEKQIRAGTHVFHLGRGIAVQGMVVDAEDRPVSGAKVFAGSVGQSNERQASTDIDGTFVISGCKPGRSKLTAEAPDFAATSLAVDIKEGMEPVRIRLGTGKTLFFRVVDKTGQAITGASVWYDAFERGTAALEANRLGPVQASFNGTTDKEGRAAWENAPDRELTFDVHKRGYMRVDGVRLRPDDQEHLISLPPALTITGNVTDASTGKPVPRFRIICGWPETNLWQGGTVPHWSTLERFWVNFTGGTFRHSLEEPVVVNTRNRGYVFKFEAENYEAFVSRPVAPEEGEVQLNVALQPAAATTLTVLLPDGRPAMAADVGLVSAGAGLRLVSGGFERRNGVSGGAVLSTAGDGKVSLPADRSLQKVVAVHAQGYGEAALATLQVQPILRLQSGGSIEGTCWRQGKPAAGEELQVDFVEEDSDTISLDPEAYRTTTDAQGRFAFTKVPPRRLKLIRLVLTAQQENSKTWLHEPLMELDVKPGEPTQVDIGKSDRPVTVRLRWPDDWHLQPGWRAWATIATPLPAPPSEIRTNRLALSAWQRQPEYKYLFANARFFPLQESGSGSWRADSVTPGSYVLRVFVRDMSAPQESDNLRARFETPVVIAEDSSGSTLDLGEIALQQVPP